MTLREEYQQAILQDRLARLPAERTPASGGIAWHMLNALSGLQANSELYTLEAQLNRLASQASLESLQALGTMRGIERYPAESIEGFRSRVMNARAFWQQAGTVPGVIRAMKDLGYRARIVEHYTNEPLAWAEFSVILYPSRRDLSTGAWDDGLIWNDGYAWDADITEAEKARIRSVLRDVKPAHAIVRDVFYYTSGDIWDDGLVWDDGLPWDGSYVQF